MKLLDAIATKLAEDRKKLLLQGHKEEDMVCFVPKTDLKKALGRDFIEATFKDIPVVGRDRWEVIVLKR